MNSTLAICIVRQNTCNQLDFFRNSLAVREVQGGTSLRTAVYGCVHGSSCTVPTKQLLSAVEFRKKSIQNKSELPMKVVIHNAQFMVSEVFAAGFRENGKVEMNNKF